MTEIPEDLLKRAQAARDKVAAEARHQRAVRSIPPHLLARARTANATSADSETSPVMTTHELARLLLDGPDLPVATHANNHTYMAGIDEPLRVARLHTYGGDHILIGNPYRSELNAPNWYITEWIV